MPRKAFASAVSESRHTPTDSPDPRVAAQIAEYLATDGARPRHPSGSPLLLLTTLGRHSGIARRTMLLFGRSDSGDLIVVASRGGSDTPPAWYLNLCANPQVEVQIGARVQRHVARTLHGTERDDAWAIMCGLLPAYVDMQAKTSRIIPVVALGA